MLYGVVTSIVPYRIIIQYHGCIITVLLDPVNNDNRSIMNTTGVGKTTKNL